jgi:hypothetical protein
MVEERLHIIAFFKLSSRRFLKKVRDDIKFGLNIWLFIGS